MYVKKCILYYYHDDKLILTFELILDENVSFFREIFTNDIYVLYLNRIVC